jgi:hypothetical protein
VTVVMATAKLTTKKYKRGAAIRRVLRHQTILSIAHHCPISEQKPPRDPFFTSQSISNHLSFITPEADDPEVNTHSSTAVRRIPERIQQTKWTAQTHLRGLRSTLSLHHTERKTALLLQVNQAMPRRFVC